MQNIKLEQATSFTLAAIALIESPSIREWAASDRNLPHITNAARSALSKNPKLPALDFATFLVITAMG